MTEQAAGPSQDEQSPSAPPTGQLRLRIEQRDGRSYAARQFHAGDDARAWVLLEDLGDEVAVSVRDEGPGIAEGRLDDAAATTEAPLVLVTHHLEEIPPAFDRVVLLDEGRIVERGTHDELVLAEGLYAELYRTQFART